MVQADRFLKQQDIKECTGISRRGGLLRHSPAEQKEGNASMAAKSVAQSPPSGSGPRTFRPTCICQDCLWKPEVKYSAPIFDSIGKKLGKKQKNRDSIYKISDKITDCNFEVTGL